MLLKWIRSIVRLFDTFIPDNQTDDDSIGWLPVPPGAGLHIGSQGFMFASWSWTAGLTAWSGVTSTAAVLQDRICIKSLAHGPETKRFAVDDASRYGLLLDTVALREGRYTNHNRYPAADRQGFYRWKIDVIHYLLKMLSTVGLIDSLNPAPETIYAEEMGGAR